MAEQSEDQIESIVSSLEEKGVRAAPIEQSLNLARSQPSAVFRLATEVMERFPKGGTFLDAAFSYLPDELWEQLVKVALDDLEDSERNEAAESVIAYGSMIAPKSLHSELDRIFRLKPNSGSYYEFYPWRESGELHFEFLRDVVGTESNSSEDRLRAWQAMLQTRDPKAVGYAVSEFDAVHGLEFRGWSRSDLLDAYLGAVGLTEEDGLLTSLCPSGQYHLRFADDFFEDEPPPWLQRVHPSWTVPSTDLKADFGGMSDSKCSACDQQLHRLLVLDPMPGDLGVSNLDHLELATCLSCLGWELDSMFFKHDEQGRPVGIIHSGDPRSPEFPVGPLKEANIEVVQTPRKWRWQDWGLSNSRENLNWLGGEPCWVQDSQYPECPLCNRRMNFLIQLDSELPTADGEAWMWGSGGIGYGFWCDDCKVSGFLWQCT